MRLSEFAALTLADVEFKPGGVLLHVRRSNTDQYAERQAAAVVLGQRSLTDPIAALDAWLGFRGNEPGPLFVRQGQHVVVRDSWIPTPLRDLVYEGSCRVIESGKEAGGIVLRPAADAGWLALTAPEELGKNESPWV